ncbi:MAG: LEA type 2 family protein [Nitrospirales bacterium]|nr:LEA type 2 family protein [Nitrospirales bacterium]
MMMKLTLRILAVLWGILFLTACQSMKAMPVKPESPEVLLVNVIPLDTTMFEQRLQVDLRVRNPNNFELEVTCLNFTLHLNNQRQAHGLTNKAVTTPRLGDSVLSVETTTYTLDVIRQLLNFREHQEVIYQVDGVLHVQRIPFIPLLGTGLSGIG